MGNNVEIERPSAAPIDEIRVILEPDVFDGRLRRVRVRVRLWDGRDMEVIRMYPIDDFRCFFDQIWERLGRDLKEDVMRSKENADKGEPDASV